jgi:hypothetical protein
MEVRVFVPIASGHVAIAHVEVFALVIQVVLLVLIHRPLHLIISNYVFVFYS